MDKIILYEHESDCCGCGVCMIACPKNAISMKEGSLGQLLPTIDSEKCIKCGRCIKACAYKAPVDSRDPICAYAGIAKDDILESHSSSGGIFASLAEQIIHAGGLIVGAIYDSNRSLGYVIHSVGENQADLELMQGSKYVQSEAWHTYKEVKRCLEQDKIVLFTGTPCQVAAIKKYTGDPQNLLTIDLICHGVPSGRLLSEFIKCTEKKICKKIEKITFRVKGKDNSFCLRLETSHNHCLNVDSTYMSYYKYFLSGDIYRENCYTCPYATISRVGDLTIGDYWGIEKSKTKETYGERIDVSRSWSCILVNTAKGKDIIEKYGQNINLFPTEVCDVIRENKQLRHPSSKGKERGKILNDYKDGGYKIVEKRFIQERGGILRFSRRFWRNVWTNKDRGE